MRIPRFLPLLFAVPILVIAILFVLGKRQEVADFLAIKGRVIELSSTSCGDGDTCWRPSIEYSLDGHVTRVLRSNDRLLNEPALGSELELFVNPDNPDDARINSIDGHWNDCFVFAFLASAFFLFALGYGVIPRKYWPPATVSS